MTNQKFGSYSREDVVFLLKDISDLIEEQGNEEREGLIQNGTHYSEMLPIEYNPSKEYIDLFHESLSKYKEDLAYYIGVVSERIIEKYGEDTVLVSLARAGTPAGVLMKRYIKKSHGFDLPHYSISIIRGKGIDENAMKHILKSHPDGKIQFIDGWTGKGAIKNVLETSLNDFEVKYGVKIDDSLAVIADPGICSELFGTRNDFLIPSACLNSTVSGLVSRTVLRDDIIGEEDFHGAKYYKNLESDDLSNYFVDQICMEFDSVMEKVESSLKSLGGVSHKLEFAGLEDVKKIQSEFEIDDVNLVKPGVGETTRVLLRRVPWKILVKEGHKDHKDLLHIITLANEKGVLVEEYPLESYKCCGIIKNMKKEKVK